MLNSIGNKASFRGLSSNDINQKLVLQPRAGEMSSVATTPMAARPFVYEDEAPKKKSGHPILYTILTLGALFGAGYAAKKGKLGITVQKWENAIETRLKGAYEWVKGKIGLGKKATAAPDPVVAPEVATGEPSATAKTVIQPPEK